MIKEILDNILRALTNPDMVFNHQTSPSYEKIGVQCPLSKQAERVSKQAEFVVLQMLKIKGFGCAVSTATCHKNL